MTASARDGYNGEAKRADRGGADVATNGLANLASAVEQQSTVDGAYDTAVPALRLSRFSAPSDFVAVVYEPSVCVDAQRAKKKGRKKAHSSFR
jgi:hypothetical protein